MREQPGLRLERVRLGLLAAVVIVGFNAAYVSSTMGFVHPPERVLETDHLRYIEMAKGSAASPLRGLAYEPPFCYRILTPLLVGQVARLGVDLDLAFYLFTHAFLFLFLAALYAYLTTFGLEDRYCVLALGLTGLLQGAVRWYSYQYWMTDPLTLFLVTLGMLLVRIDRPGLLFAVSLAGVMARETYVLVFVYYFAHLWRRDGVVAALERTAAVAIAPIVLLLLIRTSNALPGPTYWRLLRFFVGWRFARLFDNQLYLWTIGSFGVLVPLVLALPRRTFDHYREHTDELVVVAAVYGSLLLANNTDRLLAYALPAVLPVAMANLRTFVDESRIPFAAAAVAALAAQGVLYWQTLFADEPAISVSQPANGWVTTVMVGFWLAAVIALRARSDAADPA